MNKKLFYALESTEIRQGLKIKIGSEIYRFDIYSACQGYEILKNIEKILNTEAEKAEWFELV